MFSKDKKDKKKKDNKKNSRGNWKKIQSKYVLQQIFEQLHKRILLATIKYNKEIIRKLNISSKEYKQYSEIEIEIIPKGYGRFINITNKDEEKYFHVYFDNDKKEQCRNFFDDGERIKKIKIIIDYPVKSFNKLFYYCNYMKQISFKRFIEVILQI